MRADTDRPRILVVDDERGLADLFAAWLRSEYTVETATSGKEALDRIDDTIDVCFLDRRMPGVTGDEVLAELTERGSEVFVALVSAIEPDLEVIDLEFDAYLLKPVSEADLKTTVERFVETEEYDEDVRQLLALSTKRVLLGGWLSEDVLVGSHRYQTLVEEVDRLKGDIGIPVKEQERIDEKGDRFPVGGGRRGRP